MSRYFPDWLRAYTAFTQHLEAPTNIHFFSGVSAIAGALNRKVWFDMGYFQWRPNFYIIIVGKPGLVNKSTSIGVAADILREVPGVNLGPSSITWQALIQHMGNVAEQVEIDGEFHTQSCLSFVASELGTLVDFHNREMIDVLVDLWDGRTGSWEKMTKMSGKESVVNPWIGLIAGTTPAWLAANVPESAIGGGFTSRCIFVYGREKRHLTAYPTSKFDSEHAETRRKLVADLEHISLLKGAYKLTPEALDYGQAWYEQLWTTTPEHLRGDRFEGYLSRKQTHLHKLAMVLAASKRDELYIDLVDFQTAEALLTSLEDDMLAALDRVGRIPASLTLEQFVDFVKRRGTVSYAEAYRELSGYADFQGIQGIVAVAVQSGLCMQTQTGDGTFIRYVGKPD